MKFPKETLRQWAAEQGLDMIGVADPKHYASTEAQWSPLSILPNARSIVVFAREIPRSYFRGMEEGTLFMRVNRILAPTDAYALCRRFEDHGILAVPSSPLAPARWPDGLPADDGKPAPNVTPDIRVAAQLAGLGEIGYHGGFLTRRFGARQALGLLFCEAEIEPDEPFFSGQICDREHCRACVDGCPAQTLASNSIIAVGEQQVSVARFNEDACRFCVNGAYPDSSSAKAPPNRLAAACTRACIAYLEDSGKVKTAFKAPFRRREAWGFANFQG
jgi:ferredoxin